MDFWDDLIEAIPQDIDGFYAFEDWQNCSGGGTLQCMPRSRCVHAYKDITSHENLLAAWNEFKNGKRKRKDVQEFERNLMRNIFDLHQDLADKTYRHSPYEAFNICDPKPRSIHKASVRDRLLHHAIYRKLYPFFDKTFIADSYSCRLNRGSHKAVDRFHEFSNEVSQNCTRTTWVLKCDIRKFFASIDQKILLSILYRYIPDPDIRWLLLCVVESFNSTEVCIGLPLGNLTSQLLVNIYMNEFDQFVKHKLKAKYYIRYADDFAVVAHDRTNLERMLPLMRDFLRDRLKLSMHPNKISIGTIASGVDFLGWVHFPDHRVLRTATKRRMMNGIKAKQGKEETVQSYLGLLSHGNSWKLRMRVKEVAIQSSRRNVTPFR